MLAGIQENVQLKTQTPEFLVDVFKVFNLLNTGSKPECSYHNNQHVYIFWKKRLTSLKRAQTNGIVVDQVELDQVFENMDLAKITRYNNPCKNCKTCQSRRKPWPNK